MDHTDPRRFDVPEHPLIGKTVVHPDTGKPAKVTRVVTTRYGALAQLDGNALHAWLPRSLKEIPS